MAHTPADPLRRENRFPVSRYAASHFGKTLLWTTTEVYAVYSLTELIGLSSTVAGGAFLLLLVWSACCDLAVGRWLDRVEPGTSATRIMRWCAVLSAGAFTLSFVPMGREPGFVWLALAATILFRPLFALADVPHNGLLRELGSSPAARVSLAMVRLYAGAAAGLALSIAAMLMLESTADVERFRGFVMVIAAVGGMLFLFAPPINGGRNQIASEVPAIPLTAVLQATVVTVLAATMIGIVGFSLMLKLLPYLAKFSFGDLGWVGRAMLAVTLGKLLATPLWYLLERRLGAILANVAAYVVMAVAAAIVAVTGHVGPALDLALGLFGAAIGGASMLSWTLIARSVDAVEQRLGGRAQSLLFGLFTCVSKLAVGLGGTLVALGLGWIGVDAPASGGGLMLSAITCAMGILAAIVLLAGPRLPMPAQDPAGQLRPRSAHGS